MQTKQHQTSCDQFPSTITLALEPKFGRIRPWRPRNSMDDWGDFPRHGWVETAHLKDDKNWEKNHAFLITKVVLSYVSATVNWSCREVNAVDVLQRACVSLHSLSVTFTLKTNKQKKNT